MSSSHETFVKDNRCFVWGGYRRSSQVRLDINTFSAMTPFMASHAMPRVFPWCSMVHATDRGTCHALSNNRTSLVSAYDSTSPCPADDAICNAIGGCWSAGRTIIPKQMSFPTNPNHAYDIKLRVKLCTTSKTGGSCLFGEKVVKQKLLLTVWVQIEPR